MYVCMYILDGAGLSKKADPASVQGLIYNAFDDVETRMHGTQMGDVAALRYACIHKCQKRPTIWQKRPIIRTKETYRYTGLSEV